MDPITFAQILLRRWWLLALFTVAGLGVAYNLATRTPPQYVSTMSLQLNPSGRSPFLPYASPDSTSVGVSPVTGVAASYREVLRSRAFGELVVQQLQLPIPPEAIGYAISTQLVPNTNILKLNVVWNNPSDAQQLAKAIAEIFIVENQRRQQTMPGTQAQLANLEQSASDIQDRIGPLQQQQQRLNDAIARGDLSRLTELTGVEDRLGALQTSHANLLVEISRIRSSFDTAVILDGPTGAAPVDTTPLTQALVFGLAGGLGLAIALTLLLEYLADAVRTRRDVVQMVGAPPLARVGHFRRPPWRRSPRHRGLVMLDKAPSSAAEAVRSLRASLRLATQARPLNSLVITSAGPREGKTFVASNLAIALAQSGRRVLLVDADLRRPVLHTWFGVSNQCGLADVLAQPGESAEVAGIIPSGLDNLWLLPAGNVARNPGELLSSDALPRLMERLGRAWDTVVFDSAPVGPLADTLLLSYHASGSILVARCGRTRRSALQGALAALSATARPVLGVVLNDERHGPLARFSRFDYYHHGYWSETLSSPGSGADESDTRLHALHNGWSS
ncbi:MAG: polysaccharide biosynthesis tyrosine autokinase [Chloroflexota bacterium]|nr:polysaccharide biosynthesis tyrosine autokinase [Chloroflexota bacterium]